MAKFKIAAGADIELLTQAELEQSLAANRVPYQAMTLMRLQVINGSAAAGALNLGGDANPAHTPDTGYVWSLRHLVIAGLTRGATPDIVQIFRAQLPIWELNGNQYAQTWGRGEIMINQGETLAYRSVGTFGAAGQITIHGAAWQVPAQFAAELVS